MRLSVPDGFPSVPCSRALSQLRGLRKLVARISAAPVRRRVICGFVIDDDGDAWLDTGDSNDDGSAGFQISSFLADGIAPLTCLTSLELWFSYLKSGMLPALGACDRLRELSIMSIDDAAAAPSVYLLTAPAPFAALTRLKLVREHSK